MIELFFNAVQKVFVGTLTIVFAFVILYIPQPFNQIEEVEAQFSVVEVGAAGVAAATSAAANTGVLKKETILDTVANSLAKSLVTAMTASIVQWINNGFEGSPAFISDLDGFLLDVADVAAADFITRIAEEGSFVCSPFQLDIQAALAIEYQATRDNQLRECRLSDMVGNLEDFLEGEFSQGGWQDWFLIVNQPQTYTPYGQLLEAQTNLRASIRNQQGQEIQVTSWGDGFLSGKLCEVIEGSNGTEERCVISKPGTVIANSLNKALGAGQDALISADEINEIISALLGRLAVEAISGAAGLLGLSQPSAGGGGSFLNQMNQQSVGQVAANAAGSIEAMTTAASTQQQVNQLANQYIPRLQAQAANQIITQERRNQATDAEREARQARDLSQTNLQRITPLLERYRELEAQATASGATVQQQQQLRQEQLQVLTAFYQIPAYTENDLRAFRQTWDAALRP